MTRIENDCCDCASPGYPCRGNSCPLRHSVHYYCNKCNDELDITDIDTHVIDEETHYCDDCYQEMIEEGYFET